jgi:hypothetical protein
MMLNTNNSNKAATVAIPVKDNYDVWADLVRWDLVALGLWEVVETLPMENEEDKSVSTEHTMLNARAITHIKSRVPVEHLSLLLHVKTAHELWEKIKIMFGVHKESLSMQLDHELRELALKPGEDILTYLNRASALRAKLKNIGEDIKDVVFFRRVLDGVRQLPDDPYEMQVNLLMSHANLGQLTLDMMTTLLQQREVDLTKSKIKQTEVMYSQRTRIVPRERARTDGKFMGLCWKCEGPGHIAKHCPNIIVRCWKCKKLGHKPNACGTHMNDMTRTEETTVSKESNVFAVELLDNRQVVLDSGATHNVCPNTRVLTRYTHASSGMEIRMANKQMAPIHGVGYASTKSIK